ncbi:hypothetical protein Cgig2_016405 [Carnegiea gigantea]|uniref:Uncharacterized protein n=1 Tax=Carnegiea gigantea TaxID=171969 RepID=A0A9Q1JQN0_9CARY|nr:hypothetical protein Cgig2_016405 [Carnegiea gigantea]
MMTANIITWNVQGARSPEFLEALRELTNLHDPIILTLFETKIKTKALTLESLTVMIRLLQLKYKICNSREGALVSTMGFRIMGSLILVFQALHLLGLEAKLRKRENKQGWIGSYSHQIGGRVFKRRMLSICYDTSLIIVQFSFPFSRKQTHSKALSHFDSKHPSLPMKEWRLSRRPGIKLQILETNGTVRFSVIYFTGKIPFGKGLREFITNLLEGHSLILLKLELKLRSESDDVLNYLEIFWWKKSQPDAICDGDRNTRYYLLSTVIRRHSNKIVVIKKHNKYLGM